MMQLFNGGAGEKIDSEWREFYPWLESAALLRIACGAQKRRLAACATGWRAARRN